MAGPCELVPGSLECLARSVNALLSCHCPEELMLEFVERQSVLALREMICPAIISASCTIHFLNEFVLY